MRQGDDTDTVEIGRIRQGEEATDCAGLMIGIDPWRTFGRTHDEAMALITSKSREVYVARVSDEVVGFVVLLLQGAFVGFVQTLAVKPKWRRRGVGTSLIQYAERRIFKDFRNVFLCVSSFNEVALEFYRRLGYQQVGELSDMMIRGHSEILLRKTTGPLIDGDGVLC